MAPSTASGHLTLLVEGGLLTQVRQGRHVTFGSPTPRGPAPRRLRRSCRSDGAGRAPADVAITDALLRTGLLQEATGFALTDAGLAWFADTLGGLTCSASTWPAPADHRVRSNPLARGRRVVGSPACGNGPRCFR
ncbi:MAG TPA: hypothetical protein VF462_05320, partial [Micromonosporaceae bacterium]